MHFLGLKWDNRTCAPYVQYRDSPHSGGDISLLELVSGKRIHVTIGREKYCIGHFSHPDYHHVPCARAVLLDDASRAQCADCLSHDTALFLPLGNLNDTQRALVRSQPHLNYINLFGPDLIKVGVAAQIRKYTRVHEQGAHATLFITVCDGVMAREIEEVISQALHVKQRISVSAKLEKLYLYVGPDEAYKKLMDIYLQVKSILIHRYSKCMLTEPEYLYNIGYYSLKNKETELYSIADIGVIREISGTIKALIGELLVIQDSSGKLIALNAKLLLGRLVGIDADTTTLGVPLVACKKVTYEHSEQRSLF